jgi:Protein of unknown function (DUF3800)
MYIYADESGHSGKNIFALPESYRQGAILFVDDIGPIVGPILKKHQLALSVSEIHANALQDSSKIAEIALELIEALDAATIWQFPITIIEKPYLATTKFVDSVFDSGENIGARSFWYNVAYFRHVLCCLVDNLLTPRNRQRFWSAYLADDYEELKAAIRNAQTYLNRYTSDRRLTEVVVDAFRFALKYPEEITLTASARRDSYKGHTPNMVAFSSLIQEIHKFAEENDSQPIAFYHDEQKEFGKTMRQYHEIFSKFRLIQADTFAAPMPLDVKLSKYDLGKFSLPQSKDFLPLQVVDVLLWVAQRDNDLTVEVAQRCILEKGENFSISRAMSECIRFAGFKWLVEHPCSDTQLERGRHLQQDMEERYRQRLAEFRQNKTKG